MNVRFVCAIGVGIAILVSAHYALASQETEASSPRVEALACAPALAWEEPEEPIRLVGSEEGPVQRMYGRHDTIVLSAGLDRGLAVGQEYFVRRLITPMGGRGATEPVPRARHTAGWVRIAAVEQEGAVATVVYACDTLEQGDYLEPFAAPAPVAAASTGGRPDYASPGTILFGRNGSEVIGAGQFLVFSLGTDHGVTVGQRVSLFRETFGAPGPVADLGEGFVVAVTPDSGTVHVTRIRDAVYAGDLVAVHR